MSNDVHRVITQGIEIIMASRLVYIYWSWVSQMAYFWANWTFPLTLNSRVDNWHIEIETNLFVVSKQTHYFCEYFTTSYRNLRLHWNPFQSIPNMNRNEIEKCMHCSRKCLNLTEGIQWDLHYFIFEKVPKRSSFKKC